MRDDDDTPLKDLARGPPRSIQPGTHPPSPFPPRLVPHGTCRRNEASRAVPPSGSWLPLSSLQYEEGKGATTGKSAIHIQNASTIARTDSKSKRTVSKNRTHTT